MDETRQASTCPRCGRPLPLDAPEGLCPSCVLEAGADDLTAGPDSEAPTILSSGTAAVGPSSDAPQLQAGAVFGGYRIGRQLGRGGMGEVYEGEHLDSGRRLALKVLRSRLSRAEDRARFLREGQLAASISHPHTVYIFGSEEIDGRPVISMELLPGGTLKDRVQEDGPLPYPDAVRAVLEMLGGLDAAQAAGILHRDIKPSNCFTDVDGTVKVGDFGLSISTLARDVRAGDGPQGFEGTPQFAPPEQLRGEALDVRADIYAVGATLYYLLTGQPPFEAATLRDLVARVLHDAPVSPRARRPDVPKALAAIVLECLAKDPADRPASHAALADRLRPFALSNYVPAPPGTRTIAGLIDLFLVSLPASFVDDVTVTVVGAAGRQTSGSINITTAVVLLLYFLLLEGVWGASVGKRLFGLRVTSPGGPATFGQITVRTAVFGVASLITIGAVLVLGHEGAARLLAEHAVVAALTPLVTLGLTAGLFATMRRSNGFATVHDLLSGTRVVMRRSRAKRRTSTGSAQVPEAGPVTAPRMRCGPFEAGDPIGGDAAGRTLAGFDPVLRRRVWIRAMPTGAPPVTETRRDVGRVGRLRWLAGRRASDENWDAFEAPDGVPLTTSLDEAADWPTVKTWLLDLARELAASERDDVLPTLALDRIWIRADGHAVLLDFPAPGTEPAPDTVPPLSPVGLLSAVARTALPGTGGGARPDGPAVPLSARTLFARWARDAGAAHPPSAAAALEAIDAVMETPDAVNRWRRALPMAMAAMPILGISAGGLAAFNALTTRADLESGERTALLLLFAAVGPAMSVIGACLSALVVPGGMVLRLLGYAVVNRAGREIGPGRSVLRALVAWSPIIVWLAWVLRDPIAQIVNAPVTALTTGGVALAVMGAGVLWTLVRPERGPVGWITGTTVVVR